MLYEVAIAAEVFGVDRADLAPSGRWYDLVVLTENGLPHPWLAKTPAASYSEARSCHTVIVPSVDDLDSRPAPALLTALDSASRRGVRIASLCTGAFVLADAGLLNGRTVTTHWLHAEALERRGEGITVRSDVLYTEHGGILTSAGKTAALDLCLYLVDRDFGAGVSRGLARRLVVPMHRPGGQAQFVDTQVPVSATTLAPALDWARSRLDTSLSVAHLAARAGMSPRHLTRRMRAELHVSPIQWLRQQRLSRARLLLESTELSVDQVATACGFGAAASLRRHFREDLGTTPTMYRAAFRAAPTEE